jgi:hypothetical protein
MQGEHTVILVLSGWGLFIYGASQFVGKKKAPAAPASDEATK